MDLTELAQQLERHGLKLIEHDGRLQTLEDDRSMVRELAEQTRALGRQASEAYTKLHETLDEIAEKAVEKVLRRRQAEEKQRREERREGWRYRLLWVGLICTGGYTIVTVLASTHLHI